MVTRGYSVNQSQSASNSGNSKKKKGTSLRATPSAGPRSHEHFSSSQRTVSRRFAKRLFILSSESTQPMLHATNRDMAVTCLESYLTTHLPPQEFEQESLKIRKQTTAQMLPPPGCSIHEPRPAQGCENAALALQGTTQRWTESMNHYEPLSKWNCLADLRDDAKISAWTPVFSLTPLLCWKHAKACREASEGLSRLSSVLSPLLQILQELGLQLISGRSGECECLPCRVDGREAQGLHCSRATPGLRVAAFREPEPSKNQSIFPASAVFRLP